MSTRIERGLYWDRAWSLVEGCTPVSEGCEHCWSAAQAGLRQGQKNEKIRWRYEGLTDEGRFNGTIRLMDEGLKLPLSVKKPTVWAIWNDLFHNDVTTVFIDHALEIMDACAQHTFLACTKRPENLARKLYEVTESVPCRELDGGDYLPNLWIGATIENQKRANERIPILLETPAALRFVSVEPMLGPVEIWRWLHCPRSKPCHGPRPGCDDLCDVCWGSDGLRWVICGPETGPGKRPFDPEWAHDLYRQCQAAGVAYFYKGKDWQELGLPREFPE